MALYLNGNKISNSIVVNGDIAKTIAIHSGKIYLRDGTIVADNDYYYTDLFDAPNGKFIFDLGETASTSDYIGVEMCASDGSNVNYWSASNRFREVNHSSYYSQAPKLRLSFRATYLDDIFVSYEVGNKIYSNYDFCRVGSSSGGGGGTFTPIFSETALVDNSSLASSFTFSEDYHNYDFIKVKLYNSSSTNYTTIITTPTTIDNIYSLTSLVNFNEVGNDQYICYSQSSLTWSRSGSRNLNVYEIYGLDCTNATVTETQIYKASSMSDTWVDVTTQLNLFDFDWIMFASNDNNWDELQPCNDIYVPNHCTYDLFDESLRYFMFNDYKHAYTGTIGNHYLGALPYGYVAGIKFTPT